MQQQCYVSASVCTYVEVYLVLTSAISDQGVSEVFTVNSCGGNVLRCSSISGGCKLETKNIRKGCKVIWIINKLDM